MSPPKEVVDRRSCNAPIWRIALRDISLWDWGCCFECLSYKFRHISDLATTLIMFQWHAGSGKPGFLVIIKKERTNTLCSVTIIKKKKKKIKRSGHTGKNALLGSRFMIFAARTCSIAMTKRFDSHNTFSFKDKKSHPLESWNWGIFFYWSRFALARQRKEIDLVMRFNFLVLVVFFLKFSWFTR